MKYTAISYHNVQVSTWSIPQFLPGIEEEVIENFKINCERSMKLKRILPENEGLDVYKVGYYDDDTGEYTSCKPVPIIRLENEKC